ncbi:MAG: hypothetical protein D6781_14200 [Verrucomicrobia bacterium]|nr:MAG: hypothetical protein D6781_14200 [Verrucomicrobiota bacterium]
MSHFRFINALLKALTCMLLLQATAGTTARAHESIVRELARLDERIAKSPNEAALYLRRGELHRLHRDWAKALADYDRAAALAPGLTAVDIARARALTESGRPDRAISVLTGLLEREPVAARIERARAFEQLGRHAEAAADYKAVLEQHPSAEPDVAIACARALIADQRMEEAFLVLDELTRKRSGSFAIDIATLDLAERLGRFDAALAHLERILAASPRKERWLLRKSLILTKMRRFKEARAACLAALSAFEKVPSSRRETPSARKLAEAIATTLARLDTAEKS